MYLPFPVTVDPSNVFLALVQPSGDPISLRFIDFLAQQHKISLRTGCMCNPGGAAALLSLQHSMAQLYPTVRLHDFERVVGRELGVVRVSLGLASSYEDVWEIVRFSRRLVNREWREWWWKKWLDEEITVGGDGVTLKAPATSAESGRKEEGGLLRKWASMWTVRTRT